MKKNTEINSILLCSAGEFLGDAIRKLPFLHAVRSCYPNARITWLAAVDHTVLSTSMLPLSQPYIDDFLESLGWLGVQDFLRPLPEPLRGKSFDLIIDTQRVWYRSILLKRISHKFFISSPINFLLSTWRPSSDQVWPDSLNERLLFLLSLSLEDRASLPEYFPPALEKNWNQIAEKILPQPGCIGLIPGAGNKKKCWPLNHYLALGKKLISQGQRVAIFLGPQESDWISIVKEDLPEALLPLQDPLSEPLSPFITMALGRRLKGCVAGDCGAGHLMAGMKVPLVMLFGPTSSLRHRPLYPKCDVLQSASGEMDGISLKDVEQKLNSVL
ncbi:MAG: glycosyltransferase family 9 protein [bacterium]|nr:glycosyltransferase family 9 protein [bacterium]